MKKKPILVRWVIIDKFIPIYRDGVQAERIHLAKISWYEIDEYKKYSLKHFIHKIINFIGLFVDKKFTEKLLKLFKILVRLPAGFDIVRQKGIDNIGDACIYVVPDTAIADNKFWEDFHRPGGDEKKSLLGGWMEVCGERVGRRVKAKKFNNFYRENSTDDIYSNGILMNKSELPENLLSLDEYELADSLGVVKFTLEDSVNSDSGMTLGELPSFLSETDEVTVDDAKYRKRLETAIANKERLRVTWKRDGKSITFFRRLIDGSMLDGVCSRWLWKSLEQKYIQNFIDSNGNEIKRYFDKPTKTMVWRCEKTGIIYTNEEIATNKFESREIEVRDSWVDMYLLHENKYREKFLAYCEKYNLQLALKGELLGMGGSGKTNNPDSKLKQPFVSLFSLYDVSGVKEKKLNLSNEHNLDRFCLETKLPQIEILWEGTVNNIEELFTICRNIFIDFKNNKKMVIEGVVINTTHSNTVSTKFMNGEYDSKK